MNKNYNSLKISNNGIILMYVVIISALIIFLDNFITSMEWFDKLYIHAIVNQDNNLKLALQTFGQLIEILNWGIVLIITIVSIILYNIDKKKNKNIKVYKWYFMAGFLHTLVGTIGLTPIIYSVSTLVLSLKNKVNKKSNNLNIKSDNILITLSAIIIFIIAFVFIGIQTNLFYKVEKNIENYQENKEIIIEDNDNKHITTTFDKIISEWGNDITKNKSYKIKNVKLRNVIAPLYIDYTYVIENNSPIATITFNHGDKEIYTYTDKFNTFNLSYLNIYNDLILFGTKYCDSNNNQICEEHITYSKVIGLAREDTVSFCDNTIIYSSDGISFYNDNSMFLEDELVYANPYNDFRVYDIKLENNELYFYTVAENYDDIFNKDYTFYKNNCDNPFWITITFDMQRIFKATVLYDEEYKIYKPDNLIKVSNIKYEDYCLNKNVLDLGE